MGERGPIPKRSNERVGHRAKSDRPNTVLAGGSVTPPIADDAWAPQARAWYDSLDESGQSVYFEPSDWALAHILAQLLSDQLQSSRPSSEMVKAILADMGKLGTTEGDRRRMRIEVKRGAPVDDGVETAKVAVLARYRTAAGDG